jgi:conjugative transposon TraN protein
MKTIIIFASIFSIASSSIAQDVFVNKLELSNVKTTSIIFPGKIRSIDIGSQDVLAQRVEGTENVLQAKAATTSFPETNITVITQNGSLHQFDVRFCAAPASTYFTVSKEGDVRSGEFVSFEDEKTQSFYQETFRLIQLKSTSKSVKEKSSAITAILAGVYIHDDKYFLPLSIINDSFVTYDIQSVRFFIRDKKQTKRTAVQEIELKPVQISSDPDAVQANGSLNAVWVLDKFPLPQSKEFIIEVIERSGSRNVSLTLKAKDFHKAKPLINE